VTLSVALDTSTKTLLFRRFDPHGICEFANAVASGAGNALDEDYFAP